VSLLNKKKLGILVSRTFGLICSQELNWLASDDESLTGVQAWAAVGHTAVSSSSSLPRP